MTPNGRMLHFTVLLWHAAGWAGAGSKALISFQQFLDT